MIHTIHADRMHVLVDAVTRIWPTRGVEVGVRNGDTAIHLFESFPKLHMTLVDPYPEYVDISGTVYTREKQDEIKNRCKQRLLPWLSRTRWLHATSVILEPTLKAEGQLYDFVFIDGNHTYPFVKEDLRIWFPHVRPGGIIAGHDFNMDGVHQAVTEFADDKHLDIIHYSNPDIDVWVSYL